MLTAQPRVLRWLGGRGHDEASALDVWHGALEQVLAAGTRPRPEAGPAAYLWTAARREAYRHERRRRAEAHADPGERAPSTPSAEQTPLEACLAAEARGQVRAAVETLPRPFRAVVVRRYFDGLSPAEVARALSIPVNTVASRTHRALRMLGRRLDAGVNSLVVLVLSAGLLATSLRLERPPIDPPGDPRVAGATPHGSPHGDAERTRPARIPPAYPDSYRWVHQPHPEI